MERALDKFVKAALTFFYQRPIVCESFLQNHHGDDY
jgi:hypothetical protein